MIHCLYDLCDLCDMYIYCLYDLNDLYDLYDLHDLDRDLSEVCESSLSTVVRVPFLGPRCWVLGVGS